MKRNRKILNCAQFLALAFAGVLMLTSCTPKEVPDVWVPDYGTPLKLSHASGVYEDEFMLRVSPESAENTIYYTLDGSEPTTDSTQLGKGIYIEDDGKERSYPLTKGVVHDSVGYGRYTFGTGLSATVVRLLEVDGEGVEVARKSATYFVREAGADAFPLPVISLTLPQSDALAFYNDIEKEKKKRAEMEYFDFTSGERFALNTQIKIGGNWTKGFPYRTMNVNFNKDEKGKKNAPVTAKLFGERPARDGGKLTDFTRFRLHSGGNSQTISWFGDAFTQRVAAEVSTAKGEKIAAATTGYRPAEVYLDGEYWGLYAMREHYSDVYFAQNYGVDKDEVLLVDRAHNITLKDEQDDPNTFNYEYRFELAEDNEEEDGSGMPKAKEIFEFLAKNDFSGANGFDRLNEKLDLVSLADMVLVNLYGGNWDFMNNNIKMWRTDTVDPDNPYADGRWRFCLHDLDFTFEQQWGDNGVVDANGYLLRNQSNIYDWNVPRSEYTNDTITYRPGKNYLDFYLGNAYLNINGVGQLSNAQSCLISAPMQNAKFRELFIERSKIVKEIYNSARAKAILNEMEQEVETPMQRHLARWNRADYKFSNWRNAVANTRTVLSVRTYMRDDLNYFDGGLMYQNGDYFDRQIEAAIYRFLQYR